ncbi:MAG: LysR family transcriptional regulator [Nitrospirales bacterium]|nr:LysR family transcriptional regulator [Nitrospirales bacterium]NKB80338.1 LysR family transcriptional regulator [Nitrospirales bacterium]
MTLTQIEYILAVAKERSFRGAAHTRFVTQPTLSMQIQKLEDELGVLIFDRSQSPILPTKIGTLIIDQAKVLYREAMRIPEIIQTQKFGLVGELSVGIIPTISPYLVSLFLKSFNKKYPHIDINISELTTHACLKHLEQEDIDVAILGTKEEEKPFVQEKLYDEEFMLFANKDNALLKKKTVSTSDINLKDLWLLEEGHCLSDAIITTCNLRQDVSQLPGHLNFKIGNLESLRLLVQENFGYTLLPYFSTLKLNPKEKRLLRTFSDRKPQRTVYLTLRRGYLKEAFVHALKSEMLSSLPK